MLEEESLKAVLAEGNPEKVQKEFERIFNRYSKLLFSVAYILLNDKEDAQDCVMDCFASFFSKGNKLMEIRNIKYYLVNSAKFLAYKRLKERSRIELKEEITDEDAIGDEVYVDSDYPTIMLLKKHLSDEEIGLLMDHLVLEKSFREMAKERKTSVNIIAGKYFRAKSKAKEILKGEQS
jgi:DNA-directed RNA polymerase specialized sigma24 family protein